jgi:hypothetical protein
MVRAGMKRFALGAAIAATAGCGALLGIDSWQDVDCVADCGAAADVALDVSAPALDAPEALDAPDGSPPPDAPPDASSDAPPFEGGPITRVQAKQFQDPNSTTTTVDVTLDPQQAGNVNVVFLGWFDLTSLPDVHVTDSNNNAYSLAKSDLIGTAAQQVWVATSIKAGANVVHGVLGQAALGPDMRVFEYTGIGPTDTTAGATGDDATDAATSVVADVHGRLAVIGGSARGSYGMPGASFSMVLLDTGGDFAGEQLLGDAGSYKATAVLAYGGYWVMQLVTFR